jgi:hypothetical protein
MHASPNVVLVLLLRPSLREQDRPCGRPPAAAALGRQHYDQARKRGMTTGVTVVTGHSGQRGDKSRNPLPTQGGESRSQLRRYGHIKSVKTRVV